MLLEFNRDLAFKVLWAVVRMLSGRVRSTNDSLKSFLALSMFSALATLRAARAVPDKLCIFAGVY
jgi:hypothetical protein